MAVAFKKTRKYRASEAKSDSLAERELEYVYKFYCDCSNVWTNEHAVDGRKMTCRECHAKVKPTKEHKRCYGEYKCPNCQRHWMSAYSWPGRGQECKHCRINVLAFRQTPLENPDGLDKGDKNKHHLQKYCEKCKELGKSCIYRPGSSSTEFDEYEWEPENEASGVRKKRRTRRPKKQGRQEQNNNFREEDREDTPEDRISQNFRKSWEHYKPNTTDNVTSANNLKSDVNSEWGNYRRSVSESTICANNTNPDFSSAWEYYRERTTKSEMCAINCSAPGDSSAQNNQTRKKNEGVEQLETSSTEKCVPRCNPVLNFSSERGKIEDHSEKMEGRRKTVKKQEKNGEKTGHTAVEQQAKMHKPRLQTSRQRNIQFLDKRKIKHKPPNRKQVPKESSSSNLVWKASFLVAAYLVLSYTFRKRFW